MKCTLVKPNPCPFCGEQLQLVTELSPIETTSGKVISEFRMNYYKHTETDKCPLGYAHSKTYDNDKERPTEINEQTIEAVRDYMLDDLKKYDAASVKYQWMKRTGETVTMEVSIEKPEQEDGHEETAGD